jgi:peptidoglycan hydrolase CwlO-like protein
MSTSRPFVYSPFARSTQIAIAVALIVAGLTPPAAKAQSKDEQIAQLQSQINYLERRIYQADKELADVGEPNWACGCGLMVITAIIPGALIWYFVDVKPKQDRKEEIQRRIDRLQQEKLNLQNQMMLLQSGSH